MKRRIRILALFAVLTALTDYVSGRWDFFFLFLPPVLIPGFLTLLATIGVLLACKGVIPFWKRWALRMAVLAVCWCFLRLPSYIEKDDSYFKMGRRAHIRSSFTPELVAEIRTAASKCSAQKDEHGLVDLKAADLPPAASATAWGRPGFAFCKFDDQGKLATLQLTWGGSLIGRHGLVISDKEIPFHGYGYHGGDQDMVYYPERYYPLYPGSYIYIDEN